MNFTLDKKEKLDKEVKRIALELIESSIQEYYDNELDSNTKIHLFRKRCKRMRSLVKLAHSNLGSNGKGYQYENNFFKKISRTLSYERDRFVLINLLKQVSNNLHNNLLKTELEQFFYKIDKEDVNNNSVKLLSDFIVQIKASKKRIKKWKISGNGIEIFKKGFYNNYKKAKKLMLVAIEKPTMKNYHEWRKCMKYHYYHLELLRDAWPAILTAHADEAHKLSELLGRDHDLCLLNDKLGSKNEFRFSNELLNALKNILKTEIKTNRQKIIPLGKKIFSESPNQITKRIERYWNA